MPPGIKPERPAHMVSAEQVSTMQFTYHRFLWVPNRFGYDEGEVDTFLDNVIETLSFYEELQWRRLL